MAFQEATMDAVLDNLIWFFKIEARSIGFPELLVPVGVVLREFNKSAKNIKLKKSVKTALQQFDANAKYITQQRSTLSASPRDLAQVVRPMTVPSSCRRNRLPC